MTIISRANLKAANLLPAFDEVLALKELSDLLGTFIRFDKQSLLHEAASLLESMNHIPLDLRQTLAKACRKSELSDADPVALRDVVLESLYVSEHVPAIVDAKVGSDGAVWLKRYGSAASDQRWLVVPDSAQHFEVALPAEGEVAAVAHDGLWMLTQNGSRPAVSRYRFVQEASCGRDAL